MYIRVAFGLGGIMNNVAVKMYIYIHVCIFRYMCVCMCIGHAAKSRITESQGTYMVILVNTSFHSG